MNLFKKMYFVKKKEKEKERELHVAPFSSEDTESHM